MTFKRKDRRSALPVEQESNTWKDVSIASQTVVGVPVTSSNTGFTISTSTSNYVYMHTPNRTQILPGVYLNYDEHKLERI